VCVCSGPEEKFLKEDSPESTEYWCSTPLCNTWLLSLPFFPYTTFKSRIYPPIDTMQSKPPLQFTFTVHHCSEHVEKASLPLITDLLACNTEGDH